MSLRLDITCPHCGASGKEIEVTDLPEHPILERGRNHIMLADVLIETWECLLCCETWQRRYNLHHEED